MENIGIIGANAQTQFMALQLHKQNPQTKLYIIPGNGSTDLYSNVTNVSIDIELTAKTVSLLKGYNIDHLILFDNDLLLRGGLEFFRQYGFTTQLGSTKSAYLSQKISQQRLWAERFSESIWPYEQCHSIDRLEALLQNYLEPQILTEHGLFSYEVPIQALKSFKLQIIPFSTFIVQQRLAPSSLFTQVYDKQQKKVVLQFKDLSESQYKAVKPQSDTQDSIENILEQAAHMDFIAHRFYLFTWANSQEKQHLIEFQPLIDSSFFPALQMINWDKSNIFTEDLKWKRKNSKIIKVEKLVNFNDMHKSKYTVKEHWEHSAECIFQNNSARYVDGQILAKKPFYGYHIETL